MDGAGISIDQAVIDALAVLPDPALTPPSRRYLALTRTEGALDSMLPEGNIVGRGLGSDKPLTQILGEEFRGLSGRKKIQRTSGSQDEPGLSAPAQKLTSV
jgi:hypothetical protein